MPRKETYLADRQDTVLPGTIISGIVFVACLGLYLLIERMDSEFRVPGARGRTIFLVRGTIGNRG